MSEEIIIDRVNVAECAYSLVYEQEISCISRLPDVASFNRNPNVAKLNVCKNNPNCYFKQLKRLQQENKKLKEVTNEAIIEHENLLINRNDFAEKAYKLEQENKELKEDINKRTHCISCQRELENCRLSITNAKYKQALEEIKKTILNYKSKKWNCFSDMDAKLEKISEILDEVLK